MTTRGVSILIAKPVVRVVKSQASRWEIGEIRGTLTEFFWS